MVIPGAPGRGPAALVAPPGFRLLKLAEFIFSRRNFTLVLEPVVRDLREEYLAALAERRPWKARWVRVRGYWAFWSAVAGLLPLSALKWLLRQWPRA